jgi:hypothetical protein
MSSPHQLNQAILTSQAEASNSVINATPTGSTDDVILRMNAAATIVGVGIAEVTTAAAGTIVTISTPGIFSVSLTLGFTGAVAVAAGIGINMATAPITADPVVGTDGVIKAADMLMVASSTQVVDLATTFQCTAAQAATGMTLRFVASNSANAAPVGVVAASVAYRLQKLCNIPF